MKKYFSFLGSANVVETQDQPKGKPIHHVGGSDWGVSIYETENPAIVIVQDRNYKAYCEKDKVRNYKALRSSFKCNPAVPVSSFGDALKDALHG